MDLKNHGLANLLICTTGNSGIPDYKEEILIGRIIENRYKILEELGRGGMGVVYKAEDIRLKRFVALKFLPSDMTRDEEAKERFIHEAQAASAIEHPNICVIHEINETEEGQLYMVLSYYEGETLEDRLKRGPLSVKEAVDIAIQIATGLSKAHKKGIIHRDIKPANIIITEDEVVKILDFGIAKLKDKTGITRTGTTVGTIAYMSPEQTRGKGTDPRTDIWALGVVLYEMITGELPFRGDYEQAVIYSIINEEPASLSSLLRHSSPGLEKVVNRCLEKDPSRRFQSMDEVIKALQNWESVNEEAFSQGEVVTQKSHSLKRMLFYLAPLMLFSGLLIFSLMFIKGARNVAFYPFIITIFAVVLIMLGFFYSKGTRSVAFYPFAIAILGGMLIMLVLFKGGKETPGEVGEFTETGRWKNSIAVLPFEDRSPDKDQQYFCEGVTDDIISKLSKIRELRVINLYSVLHYRNTKKDFRTIGRELGVATILRGSIRRDKNMVRINVQLVKAKDGFNLWGDTYNFTIDNIFKVQEEVATKIASALKTSFPPEHTKEIKARQLKDVEYYEYVLKSKSFLNNYLLYYREEDFIQAVKMLKKIIALNPYDARAYIWLSWCYQSRYSMGDLKYLKKVKEVIERGYSINPDLAETNAGIGWLALLAGDFDKAFSSYKKALEINPNIPEINHVIGVSYSRMGLFHFATRFLDDAYQMNPLYVYSPLVLARCYMEMREMKKAALYFEKCLEIAPDNPAINLKYADFLLRRGEIERAASFIKKAERNVPGFYSISYYKALLMAARGEKEKALSMMKEPRPEIYALLGMKDQAIKSLNRMKNKSQYSYLALLYNRYFDTLRTDPRFEKFLQYQKKIYEERVKKYGNLLSF